MFADLDQIDLVYADATGQRVGVQTDHRSTAEMAEDEPRSLLFALARVIGPLRMDADLGAIRYVFQDEPPARIRAALEAAGCGLEVMGRSLETERDPNPEEVVALGAEALEAVGHSTFSKHGLVPSAEGLLALEAILGAARAGFGDLSAEARHTAVLELGAAAGLVMQTSSSAHWVRDDDFGNPIPFTIEADGHRCNVFGRAERFFVEANVEGPSVLIRTLSDNVEHDGLILPVLRPEGFGENQSLIGRPLLDMEPMPDDMPVILLVQDRPSTVAYLTHESPEDFDVLLDASLPLLAATSVNVERIEGDLPFYVLSGSFYAATKVLDEQTVAGIAESLGVDTVMVGLPAREVALVAALVDDADLVAAFVHMSEEAYSDQPPSHRLTPLVFVATAEDGLQGVLRVEENDGENAEGEPWWKKLL